MRSDSDLHETRTDGEQSETPADFRVSFESKVKSLSGVYFIAGAGLVKIGFSTNIDIRYRKLGLACPVDLEFLGWCEGDRRREADIHAKFASIRRHGEWFTETSELIDFVRENVSLFWRDSPPPTRGI